ncbi:MAG TPA: hypothetical protein VIM51_14515 [Desulfosporosinus sp.]
MDRSEVLFSDLTKDQIEEVKALETKFNAARAKGQDTVLIAYANPKR